ncbi:MAG: tetratricopeptide repeat protein [bacterium]
MKSIRIEFTFLVLILLCWHANVPAGGFKEKIGLGFNINTHKLYGDTRNGKFVYGVSPVQFRYNIKPYVYLETEVGIGQLSNQFKGVNRNTDLINFGMKAGYRFWHQKRINPIVYLAVGVFNFSLGTGSRFWDGYGAVGAGTEFLVGSRLGLNLTGDFRYTTGDDFDAANTGNHKDSFLNLGMGLFYYFGSRGSFDSEPILSDYVPDVLSPYEEVVDDQSELTEIVHTNESTAVPLLEELASQKQELLETKKEKEKILEILKVKLASWDIQLERLSEELQKRQRDASNMANASVTNETDNFIKRYRIGLSFYKTEDFQEAIRTFINLLNEYPDHVLATNCWYWLGESYFSAEDYNSAIEAFQKVVEDLSSSKNEISHFMLALSRWHMGNISQAKSDFEKILEIYPNSLYGPLIRDYLAEL